MTAVLRILSAQVQEWQGRTEMCPCHYWRLSLGDHARHQTQRLPPRSTHALSSRPRKLFVLHLVLLKHGFHPVLNKPARDLPLAAVTVDWGATAWNLRGWWPHHSLEKLSCQTADPQDWVPGEECPHSHEGTHFWKKTSLQNDEVWIFPKRRWNLLHTQLLVNLTAIIDRTFLLYLHLF